MSSDDSETYMYERMTAEDLHPSPAVVMTPCTMESLGPGLAAGAMGYVIGAGRQLIMPKGPRFQGIHGSGWESFKTFGIMSGSYSLLLCMLKRIRQQDDWANHGIAGCVSGVAIGSQGGPWGMVSSCLSLGVMSAYLGRFQDDGAAHAAALAPPRAAATPLPRIASSLRAGPSCAAVPSARVQRCGAPAGGGAAACCDDCAGHTGACGSQPAAVGGVLLLKALLAQAGLPFGRDCGACALERRPAVATRTARQGRARLPPRQATAKRAAVVAQTQRLGATKQS